LLPSRGESDRSWTVDITERKRKAAAEAAPFKRQAQEREQQAAGWKERLRELKKARPRDQEAVREAEEQPHS
jgi:type I restriction enzyme M protein